MTASIASCLRSNSPHQPPDCYRPPESALVQSVLRHVSDLGGLGSGLRFHFLGSAGAEQLEDQVYNQFRVFVAQLVKNLFRFSAGFNHLVGPEPGQLLRQGGLANAQNFFKLTDILFTINQRAKNYQTVFIGQRFEKTAGALGVFMKVIHGFVAPYSR